MMTSIEPKMENNPWDVTTVDEFLFYNCPECEVKTKDADAFMSHAIESHELAKQYMSRYDLIEAKDIKVEIQELESSQKCDSQTSDNPSKPRKKFECDNCDSTFSDKVTLGIHQKYACHTLQSQDIKECDNERDYRTYLKERIEANLQKQDVTKRDKERDNHSIFIEDTKNFKCDICDFGCDDDDDLVIHRQDKHYIIAERKHQCDKCDFKGSTLKNLEKHMISQHDFKKLYNCAICSKSFNHSSSLSNHKKRVHGNKDYKCDMCDYVTSTNAYLSVHKEAVHEKVRDKVCPHCGKTFVLKSVLSLHIKNIHQGKRKEVWCDICKKTCVTYTDLSAHMRNHHKEIPLNTIENQDQDPLGEPIDEPMLDNEHVENIKSEIEDEYDEDFDYEPEVKIQKFEPLSDSEECDQAVTEYYQKCDQCDYVGKNDELLRRHKNRMHLEKKKNCDICSVQCEDEDQLALHMTEHFDPLENKYKCDQCDYKGELLKHLKKHKYAQHRGDIVQCDACSKTFKSRNALNLHRMRHHNFEKPFKCDICDFATVTTNDLKRHKIATHSETKSEICHICGKGFYLNSLLKIHIKTIHERIDQKLKCEKCPTSSRTYPDLKSLDTHLKIVHNFVILCTLCEKVFPSKLRLSKHINKEHNIECDKDKMFICPQCKLSHTSSHDLNEHLRTQHNLINAHSCDSCDMSFPLKMTLTLHHIECHNFDIKKNVDVLNVSKVIEEQDDRTLQCDQCDKKFLNGRTLYQHQKKFHGDKNFKCQECDFGTYAPGLLREHIEHKHLEQTKFPCDQCSFVSNIKAKFNSHMRNVHKYGGFEKKTYTCDECGLEVNNKGKYARHLLSKHNIVFRY